MEVPTCIERLCENGGFMCANLYILCAGAEAKKLFDEAQVMLKKMINDKLLQAHGVVGLYRARRHGDDILVLGEDGSVLATLYGLRQQVRTI